MVNIGVHSKGLWGKIFVPFLYFQDLKKKKNNVSNLLATSLSAWIFLRDINRKQKSAKRVIKSSGLLRQGPVRGAAWAEGAWLHWMPVTAKQKRLSSSVLLFPSCL